MAAKASPEPVAAAFGTGGLAGTSVSSPAAQISAPREPRVTITSGTPRPAMLSALISSRIAAASSSASLSTLTWRRRSRSKSASSANGPILGERASPCPSSERIRPRAISSSAPAENSLRSSGATCTHSQDSSAGLTQLRASSSVQPSPIDVTAMIRSSSSLINSKPVVASAGRQLTGIPSASSGPSKSRRWVAAHLVTMREGRASKLNARAAWYGQPPGNGSRPGALSSERLPTIATGRTC